MIPWVVSDSNYVRCPSQRLDPSRTVFVGALHGMLNAEGLAHIMNDLFGGVVYAGIDTDKYKYPIGKHEVIAALKYFPDIHVYVRDNTHTCVLLLQSIFVKLLIETLHLSKFPTIKRS